MDGFPYKISNMGNVENRSGRMLKPRICTNGYAFVTLSNGTTKRNILVHRLVAEAFCEKGEGATEVNHVNEIKTDNRAENLEWVTRAQNMQWGTLPKRKFLNHYPDAVGVECVETAEVFPTMREAARRKGIPNQSISICCREKQRTAGGCHWRIKYADDIMGEGNDNAGH